MLVDLRESKEAGQKVKELGEQGALQACTALNLEYGYHGARQTRLRPRATRALLSSARHARLLVNGAMQSLTARARACVQSATTRCRSSAARRRRWWTSI